MLKDRAQWVLMPQGRNPTWPTGSRGYSSFPLTNHHQGECNQLWSWRKIKMKGKKTQHPTPGAPMFSPSNSPESVVPTVHLERWIKLTWLFQAKGQRQTCQWSRQLARHETPQHPSETFPSVSSSKPREEIWLLSTAASGHKHCYTSSYICHKCPRWEIEQQFMFKCHHKFAYYAAPKPMITRF